MAATPQRCRASDLHVTVSRPSSGTGSTSYGIRFRNVSASACTLDGYPGVSVVKHRGRRRIGTTAGRVHWVHPKLVTIEPGRTAHAYLTATNPANLSPACNPTAGHWVKVYPPGQFRAQYARRKVLVCTDRLRTMWVQPVRAGRGGR